MRRPCFVVTSENAFIPGLRSGKLGEQCEAVVLFPKLFQKYPFPILINSAFLKLADIFRLGYGYFVACYQDYRSASWPNINDINIFDDC